MISLNVKVKTIVSRKEKYLCHFGLRKDFVKWRQKSLNIIGKNWLAVLY